METNDIYRLANDALKFIDTIDVEAITTEDEIVLAMAMNKATQLKYATFRIQELLTQFEELYKILVDNPERYPITPENV